MPQTQTITAMEVRQNLGQILNQTLYQKQKFLIKRAGRPIAMLIPATTMPADDFDQATAFDSLISTATQNQLPEEKALALAIEAQQWTRHSKNTL